MWTLLLLPKWVSLITAGDVRAASLPLRPWDERAALPKATPSAQACAPTDLTPKGHVDTKLRRRAEAFTVGIFTTVAGQLLP